ncbi:zinc finger protein OZF-like isoform X2 [Periplaneta americana]
MDAIKTEPEGDPLAVETSDNLEKKPLPEEVNLLTLHPAQIKEECVDHTYELTSEIPLDKDRVPINFAFVKCEAEVESTELNKVKQEMKLEATAEEEEIFTESIAGSQCSKVSPSNAYEEHISKEHSPTISTLSENPVCEISVERHDNEDLFTREDKLETGFPRKSGDSSDNCNVCGKVFAHSQVLKYYFRAGTDESKSKCDECEKCVLDSGNTGQNTVEKILKCDICGKCFSDSISLIGHARLHTGQKRFTCDLCGKSFLHSRYLKSHRRQHTGERPLKCDICDKRFWHSGDLNRHVRIHSGDKPFKCDVCEKGFSQSGYLTTHKRQHTGERPFKCQVCGKSFSRSGHLKVHARQHTGEKPFQCDVCGKCFSQSGRLQSHAHKHRGKKPFQCEFCEKSYWESGDLKRHTRLHTGD